MDIIITTTKTTILFSLLVVVCLSQGAAVWAFTNGINKKVNQNMLNTKLVLERLVTLNKPDFLLSNNEYCVIVGNTYDKI